MPKPKLSFNQFNLRNQSFENDVNLVARAGYQGIGISKRKLEPFGEKKGIRLIRDSGLETACYAAAGKFLIPGKRQSQIDDTKQSIAVAAELGASCLVMVTGPRGNLDWEEANKQFQDALAEILPVAEQYQIPLALEALPTFRTNMSYLHSLKDTLDVVNQVNSDYFGVLLDFWYHWPERNFYQNITQNIDKCFLVQVSDHNPDGYNLMHRAPIGEGVMPLHKILQTIKEAGYTDWYDVEVFGESLTPKQRGGLIQNSRDAFDNIWSEIHQDSTA